MPNFISDGLEIAYVDEGEGEPILLIHGFGSSLAVNWRSTNWIDTLVRDGRRVIAMDVRGHGNSAKPRETALYRPALLAADAGRLVDHLGIGRIDVMGYSMGARIATFLALARPEIVRSLIIGGLGIALVEGLGGQEEIAAALEAPPGTEIASAVGRSYRRFGEATKSDLPALAACMRSMRENVSATDIGRLTMPVLVAVGDRDEVAGSPDRLAALIPGAEVLVIPGRDHMQATGDRAYKQGVLAFLKARP
ncbi:MAG: alpha/beta hydrolase [Rhizobiales bacterium]|nr:alpha/beta hydrolase [Hyphomicrobiales bacterium]